MGVYLLRVVCFHNSDLIEITSVHCEFYYHECFVLFDTCKPLFSIYLETHITYALLR